MGHCLSWVSSETYFGLKNVRVVFACSGLVLFVVCSYLNESMAVFLQHVCSYGNQNSPICSSCWLKLTKQSKA